jgi:hypothetical protein
MSYFICRSTLGFSLLCCVAFSGVNSSFGQAVKIKSLRDQVTESIRQQTNLYERQMQIAVAEIDRLCDLTAVQEQKLGIAAKGAIEEALLPRSADFTSKPIKDIDAIIDARVKAEEVRIQEILKQAIKLEEAGVELPWSALGLTVHAVADDAALGSTRWKMSLEQILTPDQVVKYDQAKKVRRARVLAARIQLVLTQLDELLLMNDDQMQKMETLLAEVMLQSSTARALLTGNPSFFPERIHVIPYSKAKEFLAEDQLRHWQAVSTNYGRVKRR